MEECVHRTRCQGLSNRDNDRTRCHGLSNRDNDRTRCHGLSNRDNDRTRCHGLSNMDNDRTRCHGLVTGTIFWNHERTRCHGLSNRCHLSKQGHNSRIIKGIITNFKLDLHIVVKNDLHKQNLSFFYF